MHSQLAIHSYVTKVSLGCSQEERSELQEVVFDITFPFKEPPPGETTDRLADTLCYAQVCELVEKTMENKSFQLVEHIAYKISDKLQIHFPMRPFQLKVHKLSPPIERLNGGVTYEIFYSPEEG
jgi:dihydroneopterin aldolase